LGERLAGHPLDDEREQQVIAAVVLVACAGGEVELALALEQGKHLGTGKGLVEAPALQLEKRTIVPASRWCGAPDAGS
jgi:hypothetical protein